MATSLISGKSLVIHKSGRWLFRGGIDFYGSLSGVTDYIFDLWTTPKYFYKNVYLVFFDGKNKLYLPCLPVDIVEKYVTDKYSKFYVRFIYKNEKYTFLFSDQKGTALGSYMDTRDKSKNFLTDNVTWKVTRIKTGFSGDNYDGATITFTCETYIPQRIGMSYKRYFREIEETNYSGNVSTKDYLYAELYNDPRTVNIIGGKNSFSISQGFSSRTIVPMYPYEEKIKETCDIDSYYYIWTIDWKSIATNIEDEGIALSKYITYSERQE